MKRLLCALTLLLAVGSNGAEDAIPSYIAPQSVELYRFWQPDGVVRELDRTSATTLKGANGWKGTIKGDCIVLHTGSDAEPGWQGRYIFEKGRLDYFVSKGGVRKFTWKNTLQSTNPMMMWPEASEDTRDVRRDLSPWKRSRRLRLWFDNPNRAGTMLAEIGLLFLSLLAWLRRRGGNSLSTVRAKVGAGVVGLGLVASLVMLWQTGSRGAALSLLTGGAVWGAFEILSANATNRKRLIRWGIGLLVVALLFAGGLANSLSNKRAKGDSLRSNILHAVPQMMCDAPQGWGFYDSGRAYRDWYQRPDDDWVTWSLVSDHLTTLVNAGWLGRFGYLFGWLAVLGLLGLAARKRESARLALALVLVMGVSSAFNRIYLDAWSLWIAPLAALGWAIWRIPRRRPVRSVWWTLGVAAALAGVTLGTFVLMANNSRRDVRVRADGRRILLNSPHPALWVVDDGWVLGGGMVGKELHAMYAANPNLQGMGYVKSVFELPSAGVRRLVLAGKAGYKFLLALSDGKFPADFQVPPEIVFLSPPFPPSLVPELLLKNAKVRLIIGEFAALRSEEYLNPPPWVTVVSAAELYIPDWIDRCVNGNGR